MYCSAFTFLLKTILNITGKSCESSCAEITAHPVLYWIAHSSPTSVHACCKVVRHRKGGRGGRDRITDMNSQDALVAAGGCNSRGHLADRFLPITKKARLTSPLTSAGSGHCSSPHVAPWAVAAPVVKRARMLDEVDAASLAVDLMAAATRVNKVDDLRKQILLRNAVRAQMLHSRRHGYW